MNIMHFDCMEKNNTATAVFKTFFVCLFFGSCIQNLLGSKILGDTVLLGIVSDLNGIDWNSCLLDMLRLNKSRLCPYAFILRIENVFFFLISFKQQWA